MLTKTDRRKRAAIDAEATVEAETAERTAKREAALKRRHDARSRVEIAEAMIGSGDLIPSSEDLAELDADREEAGIGRRPIPNQRMADRDVVTLAAFTARRAIDVERRAGWRADRNRRRDLLPEVAAMISAAVMALSEGALPPMWKDAPEPSGAADLAAYLSAKVDIRAKWRAALLPIGRAVVWEHRQEDEGKREARNVLSDAEASDRTAAEIMAHAHDVARDIADHLSEGGRAMTDRERTGMVAALLDGEKITSGQRAEIDGRASAGAQRKAETLGRSAMRVRWPHLEDFRADIRAASYGIRDEREREIEATAAQWGPEGVAALKTAADVWAAAEWLKEAARVPAQRPETRASNYATRRAAGLAPWPCRCAPVKKTGKASRLPIAPLSADRAAMPTERQPETAETVTAALARQWHRRALRDLAGATWGQPATVPANPRATMRPDVESSGRKWESPADCRARLVAERAVWEGVRV